MDDEFYNYQHMGRDGSAEYPEPISMEPNYQHNIQLKEPANVLYDYYNNPNVSFSHHNFRNHLDDIDDGIDRIHNDDLNDPKMVMIRQLNDDEKDWSEEDISDLETDAKNDTLPPPSLASTNITNINQRNNPLLNNQNLNNLNRYNQNNNDPNQPNYVNVNDLINNIGFGMNKS